MRQLVVLVGVAGSGKTSFRLQHPDWVVVSKDVIRRTVFHRDFDPVFEDSVEGIFASTLVETVESEAEVVCVDNSNLTGEERLRLIEVGKLAGRETIAYVMRLLSVEELYDRKTRQLAGLAEAFPDLVVRGHTRHLLPPLDLPSLLPARHVIFDAPGEISNRGSGIGGAGARARRL